MTSDAGLKPNRSGYYLILFLLVSAFCISPFFSTESSAQPGTHFYIISGTIFDEDDNGVPNATIEILNKDTGETQYREANEKGNYSYNLANHEEGWEEGNEIVITARLSVFASVTIFPREDDPGGKEDVNITVPYLMILSPGAGEKLMKKGENFTVKIEYLPKIDLSHISYTMDSIEIANITANSTNLFFKDYADGTHKLRVIVTYTSGESHAKEIFFTLESEEEDGIDLMIVALLLVIVIAVIAFVLYRKASQGNGTE